MRLKSLLLAAVLCVATTSAAHAQIPITKTSGSVDASTRVLVSNASADEGADPAEALKVSNAFRAAIARIFDGKKTVIQKEIIGLALKRFGFEADSPLDGSSLTALAEQLKAGIYVALKVKPGADGKLVAVATVNGKGAVTADGTNPGALGETLADLLKRSM